MMRRISPFVKIVELLLGMTVCVVFQKHVAPLIELRRKGVIEAWWGEDLVACAELNVAPGLW